MQLNLNMATFIGIDAHQGQHTACAINRFSEQKEDLTFDNSRKGIKEFLAWLKGIDSGKDNIVVGIEGGGSARHALVANLVNSYEHVYEVNPLYTKQRRSFGTRWDKSDVRDAKVIAEVLTRDLAQLPKIRQEEYSASRLCLRKTVWFYEKITVQGARIKTHLKQLEREKDLSQTKEEKQLLSLIVKEKKKELVRIKKLQKKLETRLDGLLESEGKNLTSMPGISTILAAKIVGYTNGIERFKRINSYIRYAGIAPVEKSSGKKKRHTKNKRGNRKLNSAFYFVALGQLRLNPKSKAYFEKKVAEGKTKKHAIRCLTRRIASMVYAMLKSGKAYRE